MNYIPYEKLRHVLFTFEINLIAVSPTKLRKLLSSKFDPVSRGEISVVCIITFVTEKFQRLEYIGMTTQNLKSLKKEHKSDMRFNSPATTLFRFYQKQNINIDFHNAKTICPLRNY